MLVESNEIAVDLWQIIAHFGYEHQKHKAVEELSELIEAISRDLNGHGDRANIAEEIGDCYLILAQMELIYGNHHEVVLDVRRKLGRTLDQVEAEKRGEKGSGAREKGTP